MRFFLRGLAGLMILAVTLGLLGLGAARIADALRQRAADAGRPRPVAERLVSVAVERIRRETVHPVITAFGRIEAPEALEIRAPLGGRILAIAPELRDGGRVAAGTLLVQIDPADARSARDRARAGLAEAEAELSEAQAALPLAREDLAAAITQRDLRAQALERQRALAGRRVSTEASLETAALALAQAEQAVVGRRQALAQAEARVARARIARERARLALDDAERALAETEIRAPFAGLVADVAALPGRRVAANEPLGRLIDPQRMEVAFRLATADFARLTDAAGRLRPLPVTVVLAPGVTAAGRLARVGATQDPDQAGRLVHATLDLGPDTLLRPGDFVTVAITEPPLTDVAILPATALGPDGDILIVGADDRLNALTLPVLLRRGDTVVLDGAPEGARVVLHRRPDLGPGMRVRPVLPESGPDADLVRLTPERRAALIAAVAASPRITPQMRARILARLQAERVPGALVRRLESRRGG
ncbi:MAG: hypothetical protein KatS3mg118_3603 [Paracoccaceae bacterium]|nr:MAG: hypothetical protein KatS3mg118_3603 [Paracoccaceae bacterium]